MFDIEKVREAALEAALKAAEGGPKCESLREVASTVRVPRKVFVSAAVAHGYNKATAATQYAKHAKQ